MFFDPANTGLLIVGASRFREDPETNNRDVFRNAYEGVKAYFMNSRHGPGLSSRNIFDGFDQEVEKDVLIGQLERYLEDHEFADLFVYICSHGVKDGSFFCFQLPLSEEERPDTFVRFETFRSIITNLTKARVYYIIDSCYSGLAHSSDEISPISPEGIQYYTGMRADMLPAGGACILTSNSPQYVERVVADDQRGDISLPLFTHEFLELLRNGVVGGNSYGFSLEHLRTELDLRIRKRLTESGEWEEGKPRPDTPYFSDVARFEPGKVGLLSRLYLFQNNHEEQYLVNEAARRFRSFYARLQRKNTLLDKRVQEVGALQGKLDHTLVTNSELLQENLDLKLQKGKLEESVENLGISLKSVSRTNTFAVLLIVSLVLVTAALVYHINS